MKRFPALALLFAVLFASPLLAAGGQVGGAAYYKQVLTAAGAGADHTTTNSGDAAALGKAIDFGLVHYGSFQVNWASLTGTVNATITVYVSDDCVNYVVKSDSGGNPVLITLSGANGSNIINLLSVVAEPCYQLRYAHVGVTGGTVNAFAYGK